MTYCFNCGTKLEKLHTHSNKLKRWRCPSCDLRISLYGEEEHARHMELCTFIQPYAIEVTEEEFEENERKELEEKKKTNGVEK